MPVGTVSLNELSRRVGLAKSNVLRYFEYDFRAQIDTNFYGVVNVSKAMTPILRKQGSGHIFQVSSVGGRIGSVGLAAYQSAKWAVGGFSSVLAQEVAPFDVKVTVLEPGGMRTDWAGSSVAVPPISEPYRPTVGAFADMLRNPDPEAAAANSADPARVARTVVDLAGRDDAPVRLLLARTPSSTPGPRPRPSPTPTRCGARSPSPSGTDHPLHQGGQPLTRPGRDSTSMRPGCVGGAQTIASVVLLFLYLGQPLTEGRGARMIHGLIFTFV